MIRSGQGGKMNNAEILTMLRECRVLIERGHFRVGTKHATSLIDKPSLYSSPYVLGVISSEIAHRVYTDWRQSASGRDKFAGVVLGSEPHGAKLAVCVAKRLSDLHNDAITTAFSEVNKYGFALSAGYEKKVAGKNVLVVNDIVRTGVSINAVVQSAIDAGGELYGIAVIANRSGAPLSNIRCCSSWALIDELPTYFPGVDCPGCKEEIPLSQVPGRA